MSKIARKVVHYSDKNPLEHTGGVETFARNLALIFDDVQFMTRATRDVGLVRAHRLPVICDNQLVLDWPEDIPVVGFQHGVAAVKAKATRSPGRYLLGRRQKRAASRSNTVWVACAKWIAIKFGELYGNEARHVIYHPIDVDRFDGVREGGRSRLILHDARLNHKGRQLMPDLVKNFPGWDFQLLDCRPDEVAGRMRGARAFIHLSRYEGNSIVCNEAMAMNLPCLFTRVGLLKDADGPTDVFVVDDRRAFADRGYLATKVAAFLESFDSRDYQPRKWVLEHATREKAIAGWLKVMDEFDRRRE